MVNQVVQIEPKIYIFDLNNNYKILFQVILHNGFSQIVEFRSTLWPLKGQGYA
jgi:hypothetical protein